MLLSSFNSCLKCPPFACTNAQKRLRHSSTASSMTFWSIACKTSKKLFFSSSFGVQLRLMHSLLDVTSCSRPDRGRCYSAATDLEEWKRVLTAQEIVRYSRTRCAGSLSCWKMKKIVWQVAHHRQQLLWQEHVAVWLPLIFTPGSTKMRSVRRSFEMSTYTVTGRLNIDLVRNVSQIWTSTFHGSAATYVGYGFWWQFTPFPTVKEFWKSVRFSQSYRHQLMVHFWDTVYNGNRPQKYNLAAMNL